ncbi:hypothetical protein [Ktedonobacter sp. SOSP1-52]|uniref:hypothetical protein n=1 Tax=Ktedonobacter sp. SOSP1-52 TaxID=2778366 RepID=UPI0019150100|nr:hypothetical protein [Ktedonobacter sp. SOSP1-52]
MREKSAVVSQYPLCYLLMRKAGTPATTIRSWDGPITHCVPVDPANSSNGASGAHEGNEEEA